MAVASFFWTSGHHGVTGTGFIFSSETTGKRKYIKQWFSDTGQQAVQDSDSWEKENKVSPCLSLLTVASAY